MKNILLLIILIFSSYLKAQNNTAIVNSTNGLSLRINPTLSAKRLEIIPYKSQVKILKSTKIFDIITLAENREVIGEWIKISYQNIEGYVFDKFLTYEIHSRSKNYSSQRKEIDIYTPKDFFDNLGDNRILKIKVAELNLSKYANEHYLDFSRMICASFEHLNESTEGFHLLMDKKQDTKVIAVLMEGYDNLEIISKTKATIIANWSYIEIKKTGGLTFNGLKFINQFKNIGIQFQVEKSEEISFINMDSEKQNFFFDDNTITNFKYCDLKQSFIKIGSIVNIEKCKITHSKDTPIKILPVGDNYTLNISDSFIGYNAMENMITLEDMTMGENTEMLPYEVNIDQNNIFKYNPNYKELINIVLFEP